MPSHRRTSPPHLLALSIASVQSLLLLACSKTAPPPSVAAEQPPTQPSAAPPGQIVVSTSVRTKCDLPDTTGEAPQFDFDDTSLRPRGMGILDQLALCMREGALKGQRVTIVGHTDPRGSEDYNRRLGTLRAEVARDYLTGKGVPSEGVAVTSRGEQDATGEGPGAWQQDRRVEIQEAGEPAQ